MNYFNLSSNKKQTNLNVIIFFINPLAPSPRLGVYSIQFYIFYSESEFECPVLIDDGTQGVLES